MSFGSDGLDANRIQRALFGATLGREVIVLPATTSTNDAILQLGDVPEGVVVFAETQTAGRGQRGNQWESAGGKGLWFSILLAPAISLSDSAQLTSWAATTIAGALRHTFAVAAEVKAPNDIYVGLRKIAGVLVEMRARPGQSHSAVLGIGVNVNHSAADFTPQLRGRATSIAVELAETVDRNDVAVSLLRALNQTYRFRRSTTPPPA